MNLRIVLSFLLTCFPAVADSSSALSFPSHLISIDAAADAQNVFVDFPFTNRTEQTIKVTKMDAPCSCLSAEIRPARLLTEGIKPGESGVIRGKFQLGTFKGTVKKSIALWTDEGSPKPSIFLEAEVNIPVLFEISPKTLVWNLNQGHEPQHFSIKVKHSKPIHILSHKGTNEDYPYEIITVREGWEYQVKVDPVSAETPGVGIIRFETDCEIQKHKRQQAFVVTRKERKK